MESLETSFANWELLSPGQRRILEIACSSAQVIDGQEVVDGLDTLCRKANIVPVANMRRLQELGYLVIVAWNVSQGKGGRGKNRHQIVRNPTRKVFPGIRSVTPAPDYRAEVIICVDGQTYELGDLVRSTSTLTMGSIGVVYGIDPYSDKPLLVRWIKGLRADVELDSVETYSPY